MHWGFLREDRGPTFKLFSGVISISPGVNFTLLQPGDLWISILNPHKAEDNQYRCLQTEHGLFLVYDGVSQVDISFLYLHCTARMSQANTRERRDCVSNQETEYSPKMKLSKESPEDDQSTTPVSLCSNVRKS